MVQSSRSPDQPPFSAASPPGEPANTGDTVPILLRPNPVRSRAPNPHSRISFRIPSFGHFLIFRAVQVTLSQLSNLRAGSVSTAIPNVLTAVRYIDERERMCWPGCVVARREAQHSHTLLRHVRKDCWLSQGDDQPGYSVFPHAGCGEKASGAQTATATACSM